MSKFEIRTSTNGEYYFVLKATNGKVILMSEMYTSISSCEKGTESVLVNGQDDKHFKRLKSQDGSFFFVVTAKNGKVIGTSEMYVNHASRERGIISVKNTVTPKAV